MYLEYPECVNSEDKIAIRISGRERWKFKVICPSCGERRYVEKNNIKKAMKKKNYTGLCCTCQGRSIGKKYGKLKLNRAGKHGKWNGGRFTSSSGYIIRTIQPDHPFLRMASCQNQVLEHRLVVAEHLNRSLPLNEHVHHIDGNRQNNHIDNLLLMTDSNHHRFEAALRRGEVERKDVLDYAIEEK